MAKMTRRQFGVVSAAAPLVLSMDMYTEVETNGALWRNADVSMFGIVFFLNRFLPLRGDSVRIDVPPFIAEGRIRRVDEFLPLGHIGQAAVFGDCEVVAREFQGRFGPQGVKIFVNDEPRSGSARALHVTEGGDESVIVELLRKAGAEAEEFRSSWGRAASEEVGNVRAELTRASRLSERQLRLIEGNNSLASFEIDRGTPEKAIEIYQETLSMLERELELQLSQSRSALRS